MAGFNNSASVAGGAIFDQEGGENGTISNSSFYGNASEKGGGICEDGFLAKLSNCSFIDNSASEFGGGVYSYYSSSTMTNSSFDGNRASQGGGVFQYNGVLSCVDYVISGNTALQGGGIADEYQPPEFFSAPPQKESLINCTISGNVASTAGGGIYDLFTSVSLTNCVLWGDTGNELYNQMDSSASITYSDINQSGFTGFGNIDADDWMQLMYVNAYAHGQVVPAAAPAFAQNSLGSSTELAGLLDSPASK